jgi:hypothetical protein
MNELRKSTQLIPAWWRPTRWMESNEYLGQQSRASARGAQRLPVAPVGCRTDAHGWCSRVSKVPSYASVNTA